MYRRRSGILLHPVSLPGPYGIGDLGPEAYRFADFLSDAGQAWWQLLPLNPPTSLAAASPYDAESAFAGNALLISPDLLVKEGYVMDEERQRACVASDDRVDYPRAARAKRRLVQTAWKRFRDRTDRHAYEAFCRRNREWLEEYVLFRSLKRTMQEGQWQRWPRGLRDRRSRDLRAARRELAEEMDLERFTQFLFARQWHGLRTYCHARGIHLFGDMPIYVSGGSADVWAHPECFKLDAQRMPRYVAGVPPDYFSRTGQLWGNPVFNWEQLRKDNFDWWLRRIGRNFELFDRLRIDHFRGVVAYWEVKAGSKTARKGRWVDVPVDDFLDALFRRYPFAPLVAEDLGTITPDVTECMHRYGLPGMRVLQFAFDATPARGPHYPHNIPVHSVAYTGTHDNNTSRGWFEEDATAAQRKRLCRYAGRRLKGEQAAWEMMRLVMGCPAEQAVMPLQDVLGLGAAARMNRPARKTRNWRWRMTRGACTSRLARQLGELTQTYGRA